MPQLMPFNWILSGFMILLCFLMLCFIYYIKSNEEFNMYNLYIGVMFNKSEGYINKNNYLW